MILTEGGNGPVPFGDIVVRVLSGKDADISAFRLQANGKVANDAQMIFYGQKKSCDGAVVLTQEGSNTTFAVNLNAINADVEKIAFTVTCDEGLTVTSLSRLCIQIESKGEILLSGTVHLQGRTEAALILGEMYRRNNEWKFRFVSQGFNGGLKPLAQFYGVDVEDDIKAPAPKVIAPLKPQQVISTEKPQQVISTIKPPQVPARPPVNLSKISLTKTNASVSLTKRAGYGLIKVNLNWHRETQKKPGIFSGIFGSSEVDLDLGAFVRFNDGRASIVQALGGTFGDFEQSPYVRLLDDDKTGASTLGEWLHINGDKWTNIAEILVFAFIYKGVPDWTKTDGVVTVFVPNEPPIETRLTEGGKSNGMCAVARLINENGAINVQRVDRYFSGHQALDEAFSWGFRWKAGSK